MSRQPARGELPAWVPPALYAVVTVILFREFIVSGEMLYGTDTVAMGYMARAFYVEALQQIGTFPLWNPLLFGGTPFIESLAGGDSLYPTALLLLFMETHRALGWKLVIHVFLAGVFMYGWVRALGVRRPVACLAGLAYLLAPYMVTLVFPGHDGKIFVTALTPLLFWAAERSLGPRRSLLPFVAVAAVVALVILSTHFQMAYFLFGGVGIYYLARVGVMWRREARGGEALARLGLFLGASVVGALAASVQLLPAVDYVLEHSRRGAQTVQITGEEAIEYSSSWSLHPEEVMSLVVPEFIGNSAGGAEWTEGTYWGRNPFKLNHEYGGILVLLLAGLAFFGRVRPEVRWPMLGIGGTALLFALGTHTPVWRIFYEVVPGIRLFRAPSMAIFLFGFAATTLMALGVERTLTAAREGREEEWRALARYLGAFVGALALLALMAATGILTSLWTSLVYSGIPDERLEALSQAEPFITRGFFLATLLAGAAAAGWWALRRGFLAPAGLLGVLGLLVAVDLFRVNDPFIQIEDYRAFATPDANVRYLAERWEEEGPFRVFSMLRGGDDVTPAQHGVEMATGHHPNDLGRYRELLGMEAGGTPTELLRWNPNVFDLLNIRYVLWPDLQFGPLEGPQPVSQVSLPDGRVFASVYPTPTLERAWLVGEAVVEPDDERALGILHDGSFDPENQVILAEEPPVGLEGTPVTGEVEWLERELNRQRLRVRTEVPAVLVVSENWFPAWRARVDGEEAEVLRANHTLRGVALPGGSHEIEIYYRSDLLRWSLLLSLIAAALLAAVAVVSFAGSRREPAATDGA